MHIVNTVKHRCEDMDKAEKNVNKYIPFIEKKLYDKSEFSRRDLSSSAGMSGQQRPGHILVTFWSQVQILGQRTLSENLKQQPGS